MLKIYSLIYALLCGYSSVYGAAAPIPSTSAPTQSSLSVSRRMTRQQVEFSQEDAQEIITSRHHLLVTLPELCNKLTTPDQHDIKIDKIEGRIKTVLNILEKPKQLITPYLTMQGQSLHTYNRARELHSFFDFAQKDLADAGAQLHAVADTLAMSQGPLSTLNQIDLEKKFTEAQQRILASQHNISRLLAVYQTEHPDRFSETAEEEHRVIQKIEQKVTPSKLACAAGKYYGTLAIAPLASTQPTTLTEIDTLLGFSAPTKKQPTDASAPAPHAPEQKPATTLEQADTIVTNLLADIAETAHTRYYPDGKTHYRADAEVLGTHLADHRGEDPGKPFNILFAGPVKTAIDFARNILRIERTDVLRQPVPLFTRFMYRMTLFGRYVARTTQNAWGATRNGIGRVCTRIQPPALAVINGIGNRMPNRVVMVWTTCAAGLRSGLSQVGNRSIQARTALVHSRPILRAQSQIHVWVENTQPRERAVSLVTTVGSKLQNNRVTSFFMNWGLRRYLQQANATLVNWATATRDYLNPPPDPRGLELEEIMHRLGAPEGPAGAPAAVRE